MPSARRLPPTSRHARDKVPELAEGSSPKEKATPPRHVRCVSAGKDTEKLLRGRLVLFVISRRNRFSSLGANVRPLILRGHLCKLAPYDVFFPPFSSLLFVLFSCTSCQRFTRTVTTRTPRITMSPCLNIKLEEINKI